MKFKISKIRTKKGRIITLTIIKKDDTHIYGKDKFGYSIILPIDEIDSMLPIRGDSNI